MDKKEGKTKSSIKPDTPPRKPRGFRIALVTIVSLFLLFVLALYFLPNFLPTSTIRTIAKTKAREMAGVDVDFANLRFGWNGDLVIDNLVVSPLAADGAPAQPILTVREARTNVALAPLLSGKAIINSFDMEDFALNIRRDAEGNLNLPDFSKMPDAAARTPPAPAPRRNRIPLAAVAANGAAGDADAAGDVKIPPIELHRLNFKNGVVSYVDERQNLDLDLGLEHLRIDGNSLEDPFHLAGKIIPYPGRPELGELPFTGHAFILHNGKFNPDGEASIEVDVKNLSLGEMADKLGFAHVLPSCRANGLVKAAYIERKAAVTVPNIRLADTALGLGNGRHAAIPDTMASLSAVFDPVPADLQLDDLSITNDLAAIRASGRIEGLADAGHGPAPAASLDFSGAADLARATHYLSGQNLLPDNLPELDGKATFVGKAALPPRGDDGLAPSLSVDFTDGEVQVIDHNSGAVAGVQLKGVGLRAAANLGSDASLTAAVNLAGVPVRAFLPPLGDSPLTATLQGGAALDHSPDASRLELRLDNSQANVPATPWSTPAAVQNAQGRIIADLGQDIVQIEGLRAVVNNVLQGGVSTARITGALSGDPQGQADIELSGLLEHVKQFLNPIFPHAAVPTANGSLRGAGRVKLGDGVAEALIRGEMENSRLVVNVVPGQSQAELVTPKATMAALVRAPVANPGQIAVHSLEASGDGTSVQFTDVSGRAFRGQTGNAVVKASGQIDTDARTGLLSALTLDVNGTNLSLGRDGQQVASLASGPLRIALAAPEQELRFPLGDQGEFSLPAASVGVDNLLFRFKDEQSNFGNVRARFAADGYVGREKRQLVNLRSASLSATPVAVNSRGQFDLGSGALLAEYAGRFAPAAVSSLLDYLGLPPALLTDAAVTGTVSYNGTVISSKGAAQGQLRTGADETNPFEVAHDLSAAWNPSDQSLALDVRRLDGNVKTRTGEAVATMKAQQSKLLLSRAGSKGLLDIRFQGSAGPTRDLALGLAGLFPGMGGLAATLHNAQVGGVYNAWLQVREKDATTLGVNAGSVWQGAALALGGKSYIAEAAKLSAAIEGEVAYQDNEVRLSRLFLRSDSGLMQADGTASARLRAGPDQMPTGVEHIEVDMKFLMADIRRAAMVLPTVIPADLGLAGRIDGTLKAGGDMEDIRIDDSALRFQSFTARPNANLEVTIPNGQALFGGTVNLRGDVRGRGQSWDAVHLLNVENGRVAVNGMQIRGKAVNEFSSAFSLRDGALTLQSARVTIGDGSEGSLQLSGTVDFNQAAPAVNVRLALQGLPLSEFNSEIADYLQIESGVMHLPAERGQATGVAFSGFEEDQILRTVRFENFNFATGPVTLETGPVLAAELQKARGIMRMSTTDRKTQRVSFSGITGTVRAAGDGTIVVPQESPINLVGADTADFRAYGSVFANHTMDMRVMVAGKLENLIGFTIPSIVPNLGALSGSESAGTTSRLMTSLNESAAQGKYGVQVKGSLERPDISGIGQLAGQFLADILKSEVLGGVLGLGRDLPGAVGNVVGSVVDGLADPKEALRNLPQNLRDSPENVVRGLGQMFGVGSGSSGGQQQQQQQQQQPQQSQQQEQQPTSPRNMLRNLGRQLPFGRN